MVKNNTKKDTGQQFVLQRLNRRTEVWFDVTYSDDYGEVESMQMSSKNQTRIIDRSSQHADA
jgi:ABC-type cobalt transport system substrate-binding protein